MDRKGLLLAVVAAVLAALLAGCSFIKSQGDSAEHKSAGKLPPLEVTPDLYAVHKDRPAPASTPARASLLKKSDGGGVLTLNDPFDRAWGRVRVALERLRFPIAEEDRTKGIYVVRYDDPDASKSQGFFARLNPFGSKQAPNEYQVRMKDTGAVTEVNVLNKDGKEENSDMVNSLLRQLYEQLK